MHYSIEIRQFADQLHPDLPNPTALWGYNPANALGFAGSAPPAHLGGVIVAQKGIPIQITFRNNLPPTHIIPVDTTLPGANLAKNRAVVHLHGGFTPWVTDGGPFAWFAPDGSHGESFLNNQVLNPGAAANEAEYYYTNDQSARLVWYHDHAMGTTRIIDLCISNRHHGRKKGGNSEAVTKDAIRFCRLRAFLVRTHRVSSSSSELSGRPLASSCFRWRQTHSSGFSSGA
jgi:hypothetical protein